MKWKLKNAKIYKHSTKDGHSFPECTEAIKYKVMGGGGEGTLSKGISFLCTASLLLQSPRDRRPEKLEWSRQSMNQTSVPLLCYLQSVSTTYLGEFSERVPYSACQQSSAAACFLLLVSLLWRPDISIAHSITCSEKGLTTTIVFPDLPFHRKGQIILQEPSPVLLQNHRCSRWGIHHERLASVQLLVHHQLDLTLEVLKLEILDNTGTHRVVSGPCNLRQLLFSSLLEVLHTPVLTVSSYMEGSVLCSFPGRVLCFV